MRTSSSIVPAGEDQDIYLVLDDFGDPLGLAWRETDEDDTDREKVLDDLLRRMRHEIRVEVRQLDVICC